MSAYLVGSYHINALVSWAHANQVTGEYNGEPFDFRSPVSCEVIGEILYEANLASLAVRYGEQTAAGDAADCPYAFELLPSLPTPGTIVNGCACYDYQACETPTWPTSMACAMVDAIKQAAAKFPKTQLDGAWDIQPPATA